MMTDLQDIVNILRYRVLRTIWEAQTGHLGACMSSLELLAVLYFGDVLRYDAERPAHPSRDLVLLRGHLGPLRYNIFGLLGWLRPDELTRYREFGSRLPGHEDMALTPGVDITPSGSLGMVLSYAVGAAIGFRDRGAPNRVFCFLGDGEEMEGNVAEAARHASHAKVRNLIAIIDQNGGQLSTRTATTDSVSVDAVWRGYGWRVVCLPDGHDLAAVHAAYREAMSLAEDQPTVIVARTVKGRGVSGAEGDYCGFHVYHGAEVATTNENTRPIPVDAALRDLAHFATADVAVPRPTLPSAPTLQRLTPTPISLADRSTMAQQYDVEFEWLAALEAQIGDRLYVLTADYPPRNFVYAGGFELRRSRYHNVSLREQHCTAMAHGLAITRPDAVVVVLCGDAFVYRHLDQINACAQGGSRVIFLAVQAGISGAKNGETHQSSGQPGALTTMPGIVTEEPCCGADVVRAANAALARRGPTYVRLQKLPVPWTLRGVVCDGFTLVAHSDDAEIVVVTCGMTTVEAVPAVRTLVAEGRRVTHVDITRPSDCDGLAAHVVAGRPLLLAYNGNPRVLEATVFGAICRHGGGLPSATVSLGFTFGATGSIRDLLAHFSMDSAGILSCCRKLLGG